MYPRSRVSHLPRTLHPEAAPFLWLQGTVMLLCNPGQGAPWRPLGPPCPAGISHTLGETTSKTGKHTRDGISLRSLGCQLTRTKTPAQLRATCGNKHGGEEHAGRSKGQGGAQRDKHVRSMCKKKGEHMGRSTRGDTRVGRDKHGGRDTGEEGLTRT